MAIIVALALASLITSMFVSESLDGDAAQINVAGSLRMQSIRLSRALTAEQNNLDILNATTATDEIREFERRLSILLSHGLIANSGNQKIVDIHKVLEQQWFEIKTQVNTNPARFETDYSLIDQFVGTIDRLVSILQSESEKKIRVLRMIQGSALFLTLLTAFIALYRINRSIVQPMNNLVAAAKEASKGNFNVRVSDISNDEIGLLGTTFNEMSTRLQIIHNHLEEKVQEKTTKLERSNKSLELLYQTSHNLVRANSRRDFENLLAQVEQTIGDGQVILCLDQKVQNSHQRIPISQHELPKNCDQIHCSQCKISNNIRHSFHIHKQDKDYGSLQYFSNKGKPEQWVHNLLQAIADNIAVAISLDQKRAQENLLLLMEERAVIARELHDSLAQSLSFLKLQTSLLSRQLDKNLERNTIENTIGDLKDGLNNAYRQLRELLTTFRLQIEEPSLESALKGTVAEFSTKCGYEVELDYSITNQTLTSNQQIHALQIIREALSNVQRHSQASKAWVKLSIQGGKVHVEVIDNGIGIPDEMPEGTHYGLSIMNERAASLNANIDIRKAPPQGTIVEMTLEPQTNTIEGIR
ncbi:ATP-binding protein [Kangiella koreensis]|uniref:Sensor protein n=1 Tax=Kangiella koreensis (strain DSM 16069 / JCM 12317 / KCTC 12182 / SW-125) TaxID=523791 RepID=C7RBW7_KANKD|nr:ATP-binding protein [Kangiella koreensis]ACV26759.1 histidine kinase [Kangiella koreensis DSM 16069]